ncbi:MAG: hypothetical protein ABIF71_12780 [Planctomycetota bacterium]
MVAERLTGRGLAVEFFRVPPACTLLANLDDPDHANPAFFTDPILGLDMDLDGLAGDAAIHVRFPGAVVVEFHNYADDLPDSRLRIDKNMVPAGFSMGNIGPGTQGIFAIGWWRNRPCGGIPGKYLVELPAVYRMVDYGRLTRRYESLRCLHARGIDFTPETAVFPKLKSYIIREADIPASRDRGYLDACIADMVAAWVTGIVAAAS